MTRKEAIKSLQHTVDYIIEHGGRYISEQIASGMIIDRVVDLEAVKIALKSLKAWNEIELVATKRQCDEDGYKDDSVFASFVVITLLGLDEAESEVNNG